jgi:vacuolar-type H+-ATPase subunit E/Vma4
MGIEELRASLEQEGHARAAALLHEADTEVARLREAATAAAARERADQLGRQEIELRREANARIAAARTAARRRVLEAREEFLARVFERAADDLSQALVAPDARAWLLARANEALAHLPAGRTRVEASLGVADALRTCDGMQVEVAPALPAGFRASSADDAIVVDATVPALIDRARATLAIDVLGWLEHESVVERGDMT